MERNNIEGFIGSKVQIVVADGKYDGIIAKIDKTEAKITLKNSNLFINDAFFVTNNFCLRICYYF